MNATQRQIAETFERHVNLLGYARTNLDEVARELKISKKTIYVHFDGKRDIYAHVVARQAKREQTRLAKTVAKLSTYAARVEAAMRYVLDSARGHIAETSEDEWLGEYEIAADAFHKAHGDLLRELVQGGMDAGEFRAGDAAFIEKMLTAMTIEYLLLVNADQSYNHDAELIERIGRFVS